MKSGLKIDRYVLEKSISNDGGMASVWLAHLDGDVKYKVAIKVAYTEANNSTHEDVLLQWETKHLQRWDWRHPGIVRIFPTPLVQGRRPQYAVRATELDDKPWYMVMEYLRGKSLFENQAAISKYPLEWKLELFYRILEAIAFLHQKGFAHRDLKPDNIVFRDPISPHEAPQPVLIDFALATDGKEGREIVDKSFTLGYASRERILRSVDVDDVPPVDVLSEDVWSLGVIFYEILTGHPLFKGNREKIRTTIIRDGLNIALPGGDQRYELLTDFIRSMLSKNPEKRPPVKAILYALEEKFLPPRILMQ
jgi:serine/threonine protein kinase